MQHDRAIIRLEGYQEQIRRIIGQALPVVRDGDPSQCMSLASARWQLLRVLREYQLFKHTEIFDPIIGHGPGLKASAAALLKKRCVELADEHHRYVQRWSLEGLGTAWPQYRSEALVMADRIEQHLRQEMRDVRALLSGLYRTRQAEAAGASASRACPATAIRTAGVVEARPRPL